MSPVRTGRPSPIAVIGFIAAFVALLMVGGAGPVYQLEQSDHDRSQLQLLGSQALSISRANVERFQGTLILAAGASKMLK